MESFFTLLQKRFLNRKRRATKAELRLPIVHWTEGTYHRRRRQRGLGLLTPIECEMITNIALAAYQPESSQTAAVSAVGEPQCLNRPAP